MAEQIVDQPPPVPNDRPSILALVRADLVERERIGVERYGTPLQAGNGRDALVDGYQEALDLAAYLRQAIEERPREDVDAAVAQLRAELEPEISRRDGLIAEMRRQLDASIQIRDKYVHAHRRAPNMTRALRHALQALEAAPQTCRYHDRDFGRAGMSSGVTRCGSCQLPYLVFVALEHVRAELDGDADG